MHILIYINFDDLDNFQKLWKTSLNTIFEFSGIVLIKIFLTANLEFLYIM